MIFKRGDGLLMPFMDQAENELDVYEFGMKIFVARKSESFVKPRSVRGIAT